MRTFLALVLIASLTALIHPLPADPPESATPIPKTGDFHLFWTSNDLPKTPQDLQLSDLYDATGLTRYVWEMAVPADKKMIIHLSGGLSSDKGAHWENYIYEVTGPLKPSFNNRFSLIVHKTNNNLTERLSFEVYTEAGHPSEGRGNSGSFSPVDMGADWEGIWGSYGSYGFPGTAWELHLGPKETPYLLYYKLDTFLAPADPGAKPGQITYPQY